MRPPGGARPRRGPRLLLLLLLASCNGGPAERAEGPDPEPDAIWERLAADDRALADATLQEALERNPSGVEARWRSPHRAAEGIVRPLRTYRTHGGLWCREYLERIVVDGHEVSWSERACRDPAGIWYPIAL